MLFQKVVKVQIEFCSTSEICFFEKVSQFSGKTSVNNILQIALFCINMNS